MPEKEPQTPGSVAGERFVANMKAEYPELIKVIPPGCLDCSSAWHHASKGQADRLVDCPGRSEGTVGSEQSFGQFTIMLCHLPPAR